METTTLEDQLQAELQLSHVDSRPEAVNRSEAARTRNGNARRVHRVGAQRGVGVPEVGMVREVEAFKPELQVAGLGEMEILHRREVPGRDSSPVSPFRPMLPRV